MATNSYPMDFVPGRGCVLSPIAPLTDIYCINKESTSGRDRLVYIFNYLSFGSGSYNAEYLFPNNIVVTSNMLYTTNSSTSFSNRLIMFARDTSTGENILFQFNEQVSLSVPEIVQGLGFPQEIVFTYYNADTGKFRVVTIDNDIYEMEDSFPYGVTFIATVSDFTNKRMNQLSGCTPTRFF